MAMIYGKVDSGSIFAAMQNLSTGSSASISNNRNATATLSGPSSLVEGQSGALTLTLMNLSQWTGTVSMSFSATGSTATNGGDVSVPNFAGSYSVSQSPAGSYTITLPSITALTDQIAESTEIVTITVRVTGQVFANGTDTTTFAISIIEGGITKLGTAGNDFLGGGTGPDSLSGGEGHDNVQGFGGNDVLRGGNGDDYLRGGTGDDVVDGGGGLDRVGFNESANGVSVDLRKQGAAQDTGEGFDTFIGIEHVSGTAYGDSLIGDENDNWLWGGTNRSGIAQDDVIAAGGGNDLVTVGEGNHSLNGGAVIDALSLLLGSSSNTPVGVHIDLALQGSAQVVGQGTWTLSGFENLSGTVFDDELVGDGAANVLAGYYGNDVLIGGGGNDTLLGDGLIYVDTQGTGLSGRIVTLVDAAAPTGSAGGNDTLLGGGGDDILMGGVGIDRLNGGTGNDVFKDTAEGLNGDTIEDFTVGDKIIFSDASLSTFNFSLSGKILSFSGGSLTLESVPSGRLVARAAPDGGVQLQIQTQATSADFNGDYRSDILLQSTSGTISVWRGQANGSLIEAGNLAPNALDSSWKVAGHGDFNGDGRADILWRHSSGTFGQWSGQTGVFTNNSGVSANPVDNSWSVVGVADYNGDGRDDILWRHSSGEIGQWLAQPNGSFANNGGAAANLVDPSWAVKASGDFNGDGRADVLWQHSSGVYAEWLGSATGKLNNAGGVMTGATDSVVGSGDFNGDGRDDILMRNPTTGSLTVWQAQANGEFTATTPTVQLSDLNWKIVAIGDFNGDGHADLNWKHNTGATGEWLGTASGDFTNNGAIQSVSNGWTIVSPEVWVI